MHRSWPSAVLLLACPLGCSEPVPVGTYPRDAQDDVALSSLAFDITGAWRVSGHPAELEFKHELEDNPHTGTYEFRCDRDDCGPLIELFDAAQAAGFEDPRFGRFELLARLPAEEWLKAECVLIPSELSPIAWRFEVWLQEDGTVLRLVQPLDQSFVDFVRVDE